MIDISPEHEQFVKTILRQYVPNAAFHAFGSRSNWTDKPHSDLDLVIKGENEVAICQLHLLQEAFASQGDGSPVFLLPVVLN